MTSYSVPLWDKPSYQCSAWDSYVFSAFDHSANGDVIEIGAIYRAPAFDKVLVQVGGQSIFLTPEDAEHFASAVLTTVARAKQSKEEK